MTDEELKRRVRVLAAGQYYCNEDEKDLIQLYEDWDTEEVDDLVECDTEMWFNFIKNIQESK